MNKGTSMSDWAEREVEIVLENLKKSIKENDDFKYSESVYNDALKAFKYIMKQGHSGYSFHAMSYILGKLMDGVPLSPIKGEEGEWIYFPMGKKGIQAFQNIRRYSLFKEVSDSGEIKYIDADRVVGIDTGTSERFIFHGLVNVIDEMFPIKMPYEPKKEKYKVFVKIYNEPNGHNICYKYLNVVTPEGDNIKINKYFDREIGVGFKEISETDFKKKYLKPSKKEKK